MGMSIGPYWLEEDWDPSLGWPPDNQIAGTVLDDGNGYIQLTEVNHDYRADLSDLRGQVFADIDELDAAIRQRIVAVQPETKGQDEWQPMRSKSN